MPDYVYLLENRLSADQRNAVRTLREVAYEAKMLLFLTGGAVRDLTSGHAVRELEVSVHGNALKLKKIIEKAGGRVWGEEEASRTLYLCFPGTVRVDLVSTHRIEYPKPGKPVYHFESIQEDLRRRDFTVNAMAISLNEGSFGLLMDPLNGAADIEARTLRLVSNYGFLEDPALLIRATRYRTRLGWELDPKTQSRYENAKAEDAIQYLSAHARGEELEQIGHEEDGLRVLEALDAEGWMKVLFAAWIPAKADVEGLKLLHEQALQLLLQGIHPDISAAQMQLLTAKLPPKDLSALKKLLIRPGFVQEWINLDALASGFAKALLAKDNQTPSASFKLFMSYDPEAVLWLGFTSKNAAIRERYDLFLKVWPEARQRIPHALMQEMRITPELSTYNQIVESIFLELIDGRLNTPEEMRAFLEPHSPPAPPPQVTIKRSRARRGAEPKIKEDAFEEDEESEEGIEGEELESVGGDEEEELGIPMPAGELESDQSEGEEEESEEEAEAEEEPKPAAGRRGAKSARSSKPESAVKSTPASSAPAPAAKVKPASAAPAAKAAPTPQAKPAAAPKAAPSPTPAKPAAAAKPAPSPSPAKPAAAAKPAPSPSSAKPAAAAKRAPAPQPLKAATAAKPSPAPAKSASAAVKPAHSSAKPVKATAPGKSAPHRSPAKVPQRAAKAPATSSKAHSKSATPRREAPKSKPAPKAKPRSKPPKPAAKKPAPKFAKKR
jgi:tRNA nucleotidyltransferase (CCA-adding enzyme)